MAIADPSNRFTFDHVVTALSAAPPRVASALTALRWMFEHRSDAPQAVLLTCAHLLNATNPTDPDTLARVHRMHEQVAELAPDVRRAFAACVHTTETRAALAAHPNEVTALLADAGRNRSKARQSLRWLAARAEGHSREALRACLALLENPTADHPTVTDAIRTGHKVWTLIDQDHRTLLTTCVYASRQRADAIRAKRAAQEQQREADTGDIHRCGSCDGNLSMAPDMPYCSDACRREAESHTLPAAAPRPIPRPASAPREPFEVRARRSVVEYVPRTDYDEDYREVQPAIPQTGRARKDERVSEQYEDERGELFDERDDVYPEGWGRMEKFYDNLHRRPLADGALCIACNLERTPAEHRAHPVGRCQHCTELNRPPLRSPQPKTRELIAA
ncbi:hypothetical protein DMP23_21295 [Amycolatopsis sp. A1MSW2902]|uniref:hypothetical protein n=1 Tax=Amycolatopsis sp. A1MSW2902 TaxID=687413 RepID=UPI00307D8A3E